MRLESSFCYSSPDASLCVSAPLSGERVWISWQAARLRCSLQQKSPSCVALICSPPPLLLSIQSFRKGLKQSRFNRRCTSPTRSDSGSTTQGSVSPPLVSSPLHTLLRPFSLSLCRLNLFGEPHKRGGTGREEGSCWEQSGRVEDFGAPQLHSVEVFFLFGDKGLHKQRVQEESLCLLYYYILDFDMDLF